MFTTAENQLIRSLVLIRPLDSLRGLPLLFLRIVNRNDRNREETSHLPLNSKESVHKLKP